MCDKGRKMRLVLQLVHQRLRVEGLAVMVALKSERELGGGQADVSKEIPVAPVSGLKALVGRIRVEAAHHGVVPLVEEDFTTVVLGQPRLAPVEGLHTLHGAAVSVGGEALFFLATTLR